MVMDWTGDDNLVEPGCDVMACGAGGDRVVVRAATAWFTPPAGLSVLVARPADVRL